MCLEDPSRDPRPKRTIQFLKELGFTVNALSPNTNQPLDSISEIYEIMKPNEKILQKICYRVIYYLILSLTLFRISGKIRETCWSFLHGSIIHKEVLIKSSPDLIIVENIELLPMAFSVRSFNSKILFDAREYYPKEFESSIWFRILVSPEKIRLCQKYLPGLDGFYTVSDGIANEYQTEFKRKPDVIKSTPQYVDTNPNLNISKPIKLVHHGAANRDRNLETMIEIVSKLKGKYSLDFYLVGNKHYVRELQEKSSHYDNIKFHDPVPFNYIQSMLQSYDVGFFFVEPTTFNLKHCLPNKLFEYIQARLAVAIGPSPEMSSIVKKYDIGFISKDFSSISMIELLLEISDSDIIQKKKNSQKAASELNWEYESKKLSGLIDDVMGKINQLSIQ